MPEGRTKRIPERMCVGCHGMKPKKELIRVVAPAEGPVEIDRTGKRPGRGAYLCPDRKCLALAIKGRRLDKALKTPVDVGTSARLAEMMEVMDAGKL